MMTRLPLSFTAGLALFSMFFGAGNVIFPLLVGQETGSVTLMASGALCITAVLMPILGVFAMLTVNSSHQRFFSSLGKIPGLGLWGLSMALIGPLIGIPRTMTVAYANLDFYHIAPSRPIFGLLFCGLLAAALNRPSGLIGLIGRYLTPLLLLLLCILIGAALSTTGSLATYTKPVSSALFMGIQQGYNTLDLVAALFFASVISQHLKDTGLSVKNVNRQSLIAAIIAGSLLTAIYIGLAYASAKIPLAADLKNGHILVALCEAVLGSTAALFACTIVILACFTTAVTLVEISRQFLIEKIPYGHILNEQQSLILILMVCYGMSLLGFDTIMAIVAPLVTLCYPIYILLTINQLFNKPLSDGTFQWLSLLTLLVTGYFSV